MTVYEQVSSEKKSDGWATRLARHRTGLAALSFGESTIVPVPLEALVVPLMVGHPRRSLTIAVSIWLGCLVGAGLFYFVGLWLAEPVVRPALQSLGLTEQLNGMIDRLDREGLFWTVFLVSLLPAPMQFATLGAGAVGGNFLVFLAAIATSRGIRYFGLAIIAQYAGERIAKWNIPKRYLIPGMIAVFAGVWAVFQLI